MTTILEELKKRPVLVWFRVTDLNDLGYKKMPSKAVKQENGLRNKIRCAKPKGSWNPKRPSSGPDKQQKISKPNLSFSVPDPTHPLSQETQITPLLHSPISNFSLSNKPCISCGYSLSFHYNLHSPTAECHVKVGKTRGLGFLMLTRHAQAARAVSLLKFWALWYMGGHEVKGVGDVTPSKRIRRRHTGPKESPEKAQASND